MYQPASKDIAVDYSRAVGLWERAASLNHTNAAYWLASVLFLNEKLRDYDKARRYATMAANKEHVGAMYLLGRMHQKGLGVQKDLSTARSIFEMAAGRGSEKAMLPLAIMLNNGDGGPKNSVGASYWVMRALILGNEEALDHVRTAEEFNAWSSEFRYSAQQILIDSGHYHGPLDGKFGPQFLAAVERASQQGTGDLPAAKRR